MIIGKGTHIDLLGEKQVFELCNQAFGFKDLDDKRILAIIPDHSRTAPMDMMFRIIYVKMNDRELVGLVDDLYEWSQELGAKQIPDYE